LISLVPNSFSFEQLFFVKDLLLSFCILFCLFVLLNSKAKKLLLERERERERRDMVAFISTWFQFLAILFGSKLLLVFLHFSFVCLNLLNSKSENKKSVCTERERREREMIDFIST
jgi:hypothetical protein